MITRPSERGCVISLSDQPDIEVVGQPGNGEEAIKMAKELLPDVAIIDIAMPELNGIAAAKQIKEACPTVAILMVSAYDYESYLIGSLKVGAAGYMLKNAPVGELINAVRLVRSGEAVFDLKSIRKILNTENSESGTGMIPDLHDRELDVLKAAAGGLSNKQIGDRLKISQRTVQAHLANAFRKLAVTSRTQAVLRALKRGWLTADDLP